MAVDTRHPYEQLREAVSGEPYTDPADRITAAAALLIAERLDELTTALIEHSSAIQQLMLRQEAKR